MAELCGLSLYSFTLPPRSLPFLYLLTCLFCLLCQSARFSTHMHSVMVSTGCQEASMVPRGLFSSPLGFLFLPSGFLWPPSLPLGRGIQLRYPATLTEIGHPHHTVMGHSGTGHSALPAPEPAQLFPCMSEPWPRPSHSRGHLQVHAITLTRGSRVTASWLGVVKEVVSTSG